jgi:hypothetical protein
MEEELSFDENYIINLIQQIVNNAHTHPDKKEVRVKHNKGYQVACPFCGDSQKNPRKYRGNFNNLLWYKCFNDGCEKQSHLTSMCKIFNVPIDGEVKKGLYQYLDRHASSIDTLQDELLENGLNHLIDLDKLIKCINNNECEADLHNLKPIQKGSVQYWYLIENRQLKDEKLWRNIYQADWYITGDWIEKVIVYLNRKGNKIIGAQVRNLKDGYKRKFNILTFEDLYKWVGEKDLSDGQMIMYNKLSYYYGILEVDFSKVITIFEGYGDALLWPNSIGIAGVNTDLRFMEENGLEIRYFFDNDEAGYPKSEEKIKMGFPVFLWKKMFEWIVNKKGVDDPYYHYYKISKVKDLTKLNSIIPQCYDKLEMENFFSKDRYDIKYIPKVVKKRYKKWK